MKVQTLSKRMALKLVSIAVITWLAVTGWAQITTTGIRGIVRDPSGAVIPNATIKLTDTATGIEQNTVSSSDGGFIYASLQFGKFKLAVSAPGFQNTVIEAVIVESGRTTNVSVDLQIGTASETVQVAAAAEQLNTTTAEVGATINNKLVQNLPYAGRDSLNFAVLVAGSSRSTSDRNSTFNGLPNASLNITLDGMNNNSQRFKSGGTSFFAFAPARIDAIEEVSVSTTGLGADAGGQGAMQIRMTTKRGTEEYHGKILYQGTNEWLNANSFFRNLQGLPRNKARQHNPVGSIGGPLLPFVKSLKNRLFFFAYYEAQPQPSTQTYSTPFLMPGAQQGNFTYLATNGTKPTVNLLDVARRNNHNATIDPTMTGILKNITGSQTATTTRLQDIPGVAPEFMQNMLWEQSLTTMQAFPTARIDFQITPNIGWHGTWNLRSSDFNSGTAPYPGSPYDFAGILVNGAYQNVHSSATPYVATNSVDWAIRSNLTNKAIFGVQSNGEYFFIDADPKRFAEYNNRIINTPLVNPWIPNVATDVRNNPVYQFTDSMNWVKGRHTMTIGGTWMHTSFYSHSWNTAGVPQFNFGTVAADGFAVESAPGQRFEPRSFHKSDIHSDCDSIIAGDVQCVC